MKENEVYGVSMFTQKSGIPLQEGIPVIMSRNMCYETVHDSKSYNVYEEVV